MEQKIQFTAETELVEANETDKAFDAQEDTLDEFSIAADGSRILKVRLDKWLWAARFFKTRAVARAAVEKGKVFYNGEHSKPSREIEIGATLHIRHGHLEKTIIVKGLSTRRRNQEEAFQLFEEIKERFALNKASSLPPYQAQRTTARNINHQEKSSYFNAPAYPLSQTNHLSQESIKERRNTRFLRRSFNRNEGRTNNHSSFPAHESASYSRYPTQINRSFEQQWSKPSRKKHEFEPID